ncbi:SDR family NAD(P)-dependent oxidoreductase [Geodermatophilus sp. DSM 44513]|uniref:SDR family NAD(P)-dependent oxidoreductase n=1 Tax=Geodermatophilus sp. DSM 44513 TaxID=1528104 RepID=UPI001412FF28|nr:SDR family NAD(P)-dependent oxidoreductase [Geodermatophilus sp. DSM 44513]WNV77717.1 SDR family NAD(P)-dependent oxidoreductase [Geodermatophilus sp. DSM 44513]
MSAPGEGSVAVVTGADRGIGREVVRVLAARGVRTVLGSRDEERGRAAARGLVGDVVVRRLDVTVQDDVDALAAELRAGPGRLDVLVNNAGVHYDAGQSAVTADLRVVREALETNVVGAWRTAVALAPLVPRGGRIVNVSSGAGSFGETGGAGGAPAYSVSKAALDMLTVKLAADLAGRGVLVNAVCPGWVATDMGGPGGRPVAEGAASVLYAVDLPDDGPTGTLTRDGHPIPW